MPRYKLTLEYDGTAYNGFQAQEDLPTVQGAVEAAILAFSGERVRIAAAGLWAQAVRVAPLRVFRQRFQQISFGFQHVGLFAPIFGSINWRQLIDLLAQCLPFAVG